MSAYLSSSDTISALVSYWERRTKAPGNYTCPASSLERALRLSDHRRGAHENPAASDTEARELINTLPPAIAAYRILLMENQRSLEARYPGDADYREAGPEYQYRSLPIVDYWIQAQQTGHLVGLLQGYRYQSCEDSSWTTSVASCLCEEIERLLLKDLEARDCGKDTTWASWVAPEDPRAVALAAALA